MPSVRSDRVPDGAVDAHVHILLPEKYPYASPSDRPPPSATVQDYRQVQHRLGLRRVVVVTPSNYGTDNRCTLEAIAELGGDDARGIAVIDETTGPDELARLDAGHIRGIRFNTTRAGGASLDALELLARRVAHLGWHVQLHVPPELLVELKARLLRLPTEIVLDHVARVPGPGGVEHPAFEAVLDLLDSGRAWVKLSGLYQESAAGPPAYEDRARIAAELLRRYPERMVWGSDWPHTPALRGEMPMPDDAALLGILARSTTEDGLKRVLVANPTTLYGLSPWAS